MKDTSAATPAAEARRRIEIVKISEGKIKIILFPAIKWIVYNY